MDSQDTFRIFVIERSKDRQKADRMKLDNKARLLKSLAKGVGLAGTVALAFTTFAPDMVNIPQSMRPWLFVTFIFWFVLYSSGIFTL